MRLLAAALAVPLALAPLTPAAWASHSPDVDVMSVQRYQPEVGWGYSAAAGDFTGDGLADAAMASNGGGATLWLFAQQPDHRLVKQRLPLPGSKHYDSEPEIAAIDLDADGQQGLIAAVQHSVYVYRGGPDGLQVEQTLDLGDIGGIYDVMVADWDGDDGQDVSFSCPARNRPLRQGDGCATTRGPSRSRSLSWPGRTSERSTQSPTWTAMAAPSSWGGCGSVTRRR